MRIKHIFYSACVMVALCVAPTLALSENTEPAPRTFTSYLAGQAVILTIPKGMCAYDHNHMYDAQMLLSLGGFNQKGDEVLMGFADCGDLEKLRQGKSAVTGYSGQIMAPLYLHGLGHDYSRSEIVQSALQYDKELGMKKMSNADIEEKLAFYQNHRVMPGRTDTLGILKSDSDEVMTGTLQYRTLGDMQPHPLLSVNTTTLLGVPVVITFSHYGNSKDVLDNLITMSDAYTKQVLPYNTPSFFSRITRKAWTIAGCILGIIGLGIYWVRSRRPQGKP